MIRASSSLYALTISLVIAVICGSLILFDHLVSQEYSVLERKNEATLMCSSVFNLLSQNTSLLTDNYEIIEFPELSNNQLNLFGIKKRWGIFNIIVAKVTNYDQTREKIALIGNDWNTFDDYTLFLRNQDIPLFISGSIRFTGNIALPKPGIKRSYTHGFENFNFSEHSFNQFKSGDTLPNTFYSIFPYLNNLCRGQFYSNDSVLTIEKKIPDSLHHSFSKPSLIFSSSDTLYLENTHLSGNIIIYSAKAVRIYKTADLNDVIITSPDIWVEDNFSGSCQLISENNIDIGRETHFTYPSALVHFDNGDSLELGQNVKLDSGTTFIGNILMITSIKNAYRSTLKAKDVDVTGILFSQTKLDFQGTLNGKAYVDKFVVSDGSYYENTLIHASFLSSQKMKLFAGPFSDQTNSHPIIAKWIKN